MSSSNSKLESMFVSWLKRLPSEGGEEHCSRLIECIPKQKFLPIPELFHQAIALFLTQGEKENAKRLYECFELYGEEEEPFLLQARGALLWFDGYFSKSAEAVSKALELFLQRGLVVEALGAKLRLATVIGRLEADKGIQLFHEALEKADLLGLSYEKGIINNNLSVLYTEKGSCSEGFVHARIAQVIRSRLHLPISVASSYNNESIALIGLGDWEGALRANDRALKTIEPTGNAARTFHYLVIRIRLYFFLKMNEEALQTLDKAEKLLHAATREVKWLFYIESAHAALFKKDQEEIASHITRFESALAGEVFTDLRAIRIDVIGALGKLLMESGEAQKARDLLVELLQDCTSRDVSTVQVRLSLAQMPNVNREQILRWLSESENFAREKDNYHLITSVLSRKLEFYQEEGDLAKALALSISLREEERKKYKLLNTTYIAAAQAELKQRGVEEELLRAGEQIIELQYQRKHITERIHVQKEALRLLAHDVRGPLSVIGITLHLLSTKEHEFLENVLSAKKSVQRISEMLQGVLDSLKEKSVSLQLQVVDLFPLLSQVYRDFRLLAKRKELELYLQVVEGVKVLAEPTALRDGIDNLLSNALKFSPAGRVVWLRVIRKGAKVQILVEDQGPGIEKEEQKKLFKAFSVLSSKPTAGESSIGLGLYLTQSQIAKMGGRVFYQSTPTEGATFAIELSAAGESST